MDSYFEVHVKDGRTFTFPVTEVSGKTVFCGLTGPYGVLEVT